jgi:hypothetical protein
VEIDDNSSWVKEYRDISIRTSDGSTFLGKINLCHHKRISDLFKNPCEQFIVLVDVMFRESTEKTVIINKNHIVWVEPGD